MENDIIHLYNDINFTVSISDFSNPDTIRNLRYNNDDYLVYIRTTQYEHIQKIINIYNKTKKNSRESKKSENTKNRAADPKINVVGFIYKNK